MARESKPNQVSMALSLGCAAENGVYVYTSRRAGVGVFIGPRGQRPRAKARDSLATGWERAQFSFLMDNR